MASSSTPTSLFQLPNLAQSNFVKLDSATTYLSWLSTVVPILKSHELLGIVDGSEPCPPASLTNEQGNEIPNPAYAIWNKKDQCLLGWINMSLSEAVLSTVYGLHTSKQVWMALTNRFASQSRSHISQLKRQIQGLQQGSKSCTEYLKSAKSYADQLAAVGKPIDDEDLVSFIMSGLNPSFNSFVTAYTVATRDHSPSFIDFQDDLLSHEMLLNQQHTATVVDTSSAFAFHMQQHRSGPSRYPNHSNRRFKPTQFQKYRPGFSFQRNTAGGPCGPKDSQTQPFTSSKPSSARAPCQICGKTNHNALDCFHRMDYSYQGRYPFTQLAAMVAHTNITNDEQEWLADSGANTHVTNELNNLTL